jgi:hypothetical protein
MGQEAKSLVKQVKRGQSLALVCQIVNLAVVSCALVQLLREIW